MIGEHLEEYAGLPVQDFWPDGLHHRPFSADEPIAGEMPGAETVAWRVGMGRGAWRDSLHALLGEVASDRIEVIVAGWWGNEDDEGYPGNVLVEAADRLPALRSLFLGDIVMEESEISWIGHEDITPLLKAFPKLERLDVRGSEALALEPIEHTGLRTLRFESGGLPARVVRGIAGSDLPNLEHLDLWLGEEGYGGDTSLDDLAPFLSGERLPALRHLGLGNSEFQDEIAAALAGAPVVARLESLSLSMGLLTDTGAEALLSGQPLTHLKSLDLHHNYLSDEMARRVRDALPGVRIDLDEREDRDAHGFYIAVSE